MEHSNGLQIDFTPTDEPDNGAVDVHGLRPPVDVPRLVAALYRIPADDYNQWVNTLAAIRHDAPHLKGVAEEWSKTSPKFDPQEFERKWDSLGNYNGRTRGLGSIFHEGKPEPRYQTFSFGELMESNFHVNYIVQDVLAEHQPCIVGGGHKTVKTGALVDGAVSLATGTPFLGQFETQRRRVLMMSGESGLATLQDTARRIAKSKGVTPGDEFQLSPNLPRLAGSLDELEKLLANLGTQVLIIDPAYLAMELSDGQNNLFRVGEQLRPITELCQRLKVTLILCHHTTKASGKENRKLDLADLQWSGFAEWARQWLLLSRREPYQFDGLHQLYMSVGGSAGHSGLYHLDLNEGIHPNRVWSPRVQSSGQASKLRAALEDEAQYQAEVERVREALADEALKATALRNKAKADNRKWTQRRTRMIRDGVIKENPDNTFSLLA